MKLEELKKLNKRLVRYWLFRFKTENAGGDKATGAPKGLKDYFENNELFIGWELFDESKGWDVKETSPLEIITLKLGSTELWNKELRSSLPEMSNKENLKIMKSNKAMKSRKGVAGQTK